MGKIKLTALENRPMLLAHALIMFGIMIAVVGTIVLANDRFARAGVACQLED